VADEITPEQYHLLVEEEGRRQNKYRAIPVQDEVYGYFASTGEHRRWYELLRLQELGEIAGLKRQVPYALVVNGVPICGYVADFTYREFVAAPPAGVAHWEPIVEDYKPGMRTEAYKIKRSLMLACFGITIRETGRGT
jgi:hypothetical protein